MLAVCRKCTECGYVPHSFTRAISALGIIYFKYLCSSCNKQTFYRSKDKERKGGSPWYVTEQITKDEYVSQLMD